MTAVSDVCRTFDQSTISELKFCTRAIHVAQEPDPTTGAVSVPVYQTSTFIQEDLGKHKGYQYGRSQNPTRTALEACIASLEDAQFGLTFASGMAAVSNVLTLLSAGDHVIVGEDVYGGVFRLFERVLSRYGLTFTYVDASSVESVCAAIRPQTKLLWIESPTNPILRLADIRALAELAGAHGIISVVDNTFASPYFQKPLRLGADIVVHSTTKYIGGHSDVVGGAVVTSREDLYEVLKFHQNAVGAVPGPFDCFLLLRGLKTLALRMRQHEANALAIARFLEQHPAIEHVYYPGLPSHAQHELAVAQMSGFGGIVSCTVRGGLQGARKLVTGTRLFGLAESLGGTRSLIAHPATMTHAPVPEDIRKQRGIVDGLVRLSVGIEDAEDLIRDLYQALEPADRTAEPTSTSERTSCATNPQDAPTDNGREHASAESPARSLTTV